MSEIGDLITDYREHKRAEREGDAMAEIQQGEWSAHRCPAPNLTIAEGDRGTLWMVRYTDEESGYEGEIGIFLGVKAKAHARLFAASPELLEAIDHPCLRNLFAAIEDSGTPEASKLWGLARQWFDVRDAALAKVTAPAAESPR